MGLARKATARRVGPPGLGPVDHGGNPSHLHLCEEGAVNQHALRLLANRDTPCSKVELVLRDGILYRDRDGVLMMAFVTREGDPEGPQKVQVVATKPGFPAFAVDDDASAVTGEMGAV